MTATEPECTYPINSPLWAGNVPAREPWFQVPIVLVAGRRYCFRATGTWLDASIACDANGHDHPKLRSLKWLRRCKDEGATWFTLVGAINRDLSTCFPIGDGARWASGWVAPVDGPFYCFANDARLFYWNNSGSIWLEVWLCTP